MRSVLKPAQVRTENRYSQMLPLFLVRNQIAVVEKYLGLLLYSSLP